MMRLYLLVQFVSGARVSHEDELTVGADAEVEQHQFGVARHNSAVGSAIGNPWFVAAGQYCSNHLEIGSEQGRNDGFGYSLATCASAVRSESRCQSGFFYFSASYNGQCKCALDDCSERDSSAAHNIYQLSTWRCTPSGQFPNAVQLRNTLSGRLVNDNDGRIGADVGAVISPLREFTVNLDDSRTTGGWAEDGQQWCIEDAGRPDQYTITNLLSGNRLYHTDGLVSARNPADDSCTFTSRGTGFANGGRFGNGNRRCGTCCGASDTTSPMCDGSTSDGLLHISEEEMQARCGADAACVGYSTHTASESFRPVTSIESVVSEDTHWETHEKICGGSTEESWFIEPDAEQWAARHAQIGNSLSRFARGVRQIGRMYGTITEGRGQFTIRSVHSGGRLFAQPDRSASGGFGVLEGGTVRADQMWDFDDLVLDLCENDFERGNPGSDMRELEDASSGLFHSQCVQDVRKNCPTANAAHWYPGHCFCVFNYWPGDRNRQGRGSTCGFHQCAGCRMR